MKTIAAVLLLAATAMAVHHAVVEAGTNRTFVQTSRLPDGCRAPEEGEQLIIVVFKRDAGVAFRCHYAGGRGYQRQTSRGLQL